MTAAAALSAVDAVFAHRWWGLLISALTAGGVVWVMEAWTRRCGMQHGRWVAAVTLCSTWFFARAAFLHPQPHAMLAVLFSTLPLRNFFYIYKGMGGRRALTPVWLFAALIFGGAAGLAAPSAAIAAFLIVQKQWRRVGEWFGVREVLIFCVLCLLWFWAFGANFHPAPRQHLFWYPLRLLWGMLPWAPLWVWSIVQGVWRSRAKSDIARFMLTSIWVMIVVLSLIDSKSELYLLHIFPLAAYLSAALLMKHGAKTRH